VFGVILLGLLMAIAFAPESPSVPPLALTRGLKPEVSSKMRLGLFSDPQFRGTPGDQGYPKVIQSSLYRSSLSKAEALASLTKDLGPPTWQHEFTDATWDLPNQSSVRMHSSDFAASRQPGEPRVTIYIQDRHRENLAGIIERMFQNGLHP
jgi:hypothetical protein